MTAPGRRERLRAQMSAEVRSAARRVIAHQGVDALTLAEIARRVGVTPAALYHHFEGGLPEIVYQVAEDIVDELVQALQSAAASHPEANFAMRMIEPVRALRSWAITHQPEFNLLFGTPSAAAGDAHGELTSAWVRRLAAVWGPVFVQLWAERPYPVLAEDEMDPRLRQQMLDYRKDTGVDLPPGAMVVMLSCWRSLYGQIALEVFGHFAPLFSDQEPMFELLMQELVRGMGLEDQYQPPTR
ncbi:TetR/AcrR family transcriptional regulator [Streptomyces sp. NRRL S-337]|uniref:TetR/AcrR family transcriptional regulator n=1 Tax=Streptomyces sp. NRRL S-337 TaxID=1463900 RepID=UPI0004C7F362|nr:TetR/AcrR family transcriptional regulator [Streptomyces sp. NRRL S-337]